MEEQPLFVVEAYEYKFSVWRVVFVSEDEESAELQFNHCRSMFPQGTYRLIKLLKHAERREKVDGTPIKPGQDRVRPNDPVLPGRSGSD